MESTNPYPENKHMHAVYLDDHVLAEGEDPKIVYQTAERKITHTGRFVILEGAFIHKMYNASIYRMRLILRALSQGIAAWTIEEANNKVREKEMDLKVLGLSEAEAVIYIIKEDAMINPNDVHRCSEIILNTTFSPQYLSKTYSNAKQKLSKLLIDDGKGELNLDP